jgi:multidrug resistance protein, MATE family
VLLFLGIWHSHRSDPGRFSRDFFVPDLERLRILVRIGWPAALNSFTDLGVSTFLSVLCARLGARLLAAHQVVLDLDAVVYMVPMGISWAALVRVGQAAGRNSATQVRRSLHASLLLALGYISIASCLFAGFPRTWASLYSNDPSVVAAAAPIFLICGILQIGDAAGVIYASALSGLGDTRSPLIINGLWYWCLGMPLSYWVTLHRGMGLEGLWMGRAIAAIGSGISLALLWHARMHAAATDPQRARLTLLPSLQATEVHS